MHRVKTIGDVPDLVVSGGIVLEPDAQRAHVVVVGGNDFSAVAAQHGGCQM